MIGASAAALASILPGAASTAALPNVTFDLRISGSGAKEATVTSVGDIIILKTNNDDRVSPSAYNPWAIPGSSGADDYRAAIAGCRTGLMETGQGLTLEPGNMVGPTQQGIEDLILQDPNASWSEDCDCVVGGDPRYGVSPRVRPIPLYDPYYYEMNKQTGRNAAFKMVSFLGVFVVGMQGNEVIARIAPITGEATGNPTPASSFAMAIRLVE